MQGFCIVYAHGGATVIVCQHLRLEMVKLQKSECETNESNSLY